MPTFVGTVLATVLSACGAVDSAHGGDDGVSPVLDTGVREAAPPVEHDAGAVSEDAATPSTDDAAVATDGASSTGADAAGATTDAGAADAASTSGGDADTSDAGSPLGPVRHLNATWYDAQRADGNCAFGVVPMSAMTASVSTDNYAGSQACGMCVRVTGARGTIVVPVFDRCAGCTNDQVNLSEPAFEATVGPLTLGRGEVRWEPVPCDAMGPVQYHFHASASSRWLALQVRNHRIPVRSLEVRVSGRWVALARSMTNYFIASSVIGAGPYAFRVTAVDGQVLTDETVALRAGTDVPGAHQFR